MLKAFCLFVLITNCQEIDPKSTRRKVETELVIRFYSLNMCELRMYSRAGRPTNVGMCSGQCNVSVMKDGMNSVMWSEAGNKGKSWWDA